MDIKNPRLTSAVVLGLMGFLLAGCNSEKHTSPAEAAAPPAAPGVVPETQQVAEAVLGKQAEVIAHGDLARDGSEQLLVVNRYEKGRRGEVGPNNSSPIFVTRAVIVEKNKDKWAEVLRCDEHLKNSRGYLAASPVSPVTGWWLEVKQRTDQGLELRFTPAGAGDEQASDAVSAGSRTIAVGWNTKVKRYQSLDQSHKGYLSEVPTLETPQSILR